MFEVPIQRLLTAFVRRHAPHTYAEQSKALRDHYSRKLLTLRVASERRAASREYRLARAAMVISLARLISKAS